MADADKGRAFLDQSSAKRHALVNPIALREKVEALWDAGLPPGDKTGWPSLDQLYTVAPGQVTVITGWPNSGKSEWLDALLVNLARQGWRVAIFSPENHPLELHATKFIEKISGLPFGRGMNERIGKAESAEVLDEIGQWFTFIDSRDDGISATGVMSSALPWLQGQGDSPKGLVIDPWNELEHWRPNGLSETEYISQTLSEVRRWARVHKVHVWIVAHPQKMRREDGKLPVPKPDMISGSQHWWNKSDCCITIWRDSENHSQDVDVHVLKCRFKHIGRQGVIALKWDKVTGRYSEPEHEWKSLTRAI